MAKNIGLKVEAPKEECNDVHCAFHGKTTVRGRQFTGTVKKLSSQKTVVVEWLRLHYIPKYERYEKRRSRIHAHLPPCIKLQVGDKVKIVETKPISKIKNFVVVSKL